MDFIQLFEQKLCQYTGFEHAVCVDCCTNAIVMSLEAKRLLGQISKSSTTLCVPRHTYLSIPMALARNGWRFKFVDQVWRGRYSLGEKVIDAATDFKRDLGCEFKSLSDCAVCVSFQQKKRLNLDQGGVIFTDCAPLARLCRRLRHDGRDPSISHVDEVECHPDDIILGWHAYMSPEKAARGILALNQEHLLPPYREHSWKEYPDISKLKCFQDIEKANG